MVLKSADRIASSMYIIVFTAPEEAFLNLTEDCQALKDYACFLEGGSPKPATPPEISMLFR